MKFLLTLCLMGLMTNALFAAIVVNPTALNLGTVDRGSGAAGSVVVTNTFSTTTNFTVSFSTQSGSFSVTKFPSTAPLVLAANQTHSISVNIEAGAAGGNYSGTITIQGGGATVSVPVTGTVIDAFATTFTPTSPSFLGFGTVVTGTTKLRTIGITNTSPGPLSYSGTGNPSLYSVSPASLPLGSNQSGTLNVIFTPGTNVGNFPGTVDLKANNSTVGTVNMTATAVVPPGSIEVTPASLNFGNVERSTGASLTYTLKNASTTTLTFSFSRTGNFVTSTSALSLGAGLSKSIAVNVEAGVAVGALTGAIAISGGGQNATVSLAANVRDTFATTINPGTLDFGTLNAGQTKSLNFTVQNTSSGSLNYSPQASPSLYSVSPASLSVASNQTGTFTVNFNPGTSSGSLPGSVSVNAASGTTSQSAATMTLKANVNPPPLPDLTVSFFSTTPTFEIIKTRKQATFRITVHNVGAAGAVAGSFAVKIFLDNNLMNTISMSPSEPSNIFISFLLPANTTGAHTVKVQVDANHEIPESNENNNTVSASVTF
jgi:hypothetical protein